MQILLCGKSVELMHHSDQVEYVYDGSYLWFAVFCGFHLAVASSQTKECCKWYVAESKDIKFYEKIKSDRWVDRGG